jgi:hypothetical protein
VIAAVPFEHFFDLASLSAAGKDVRIAASAADLERIAQWTDVEAVERFEALVSLRKISKSRFSYNAVLTADFVQSCVVTLVPVTAHIEKSFERILNVVSHLPRDLAAHGDLPISPTDDDPQEDIESTRFDLVAPLLEELVLVLDPYPRAPGVAFEPSAASLAKEESPFAVLKALKNKE